MKHSVGLLCSTPHEGHSVLTQGTQDVLNNVKLTGEHEASQSQYMEVLHAHV